MLVLPCLLISGAGFSAEKSNDQYADMHKQLTIMNNIIKSAVSGKSASHSSEINSIQSTYLRGQGVVFTISAAARKRQWGSYNFNFIMPEIPVAPIAPEVNQEFQEKFDIDVNETVTQALDSADYESAMEVFEEYRDSARELREQQRDMAYRVREIEREKRDISFQLARASDDHKAELKQALAKLTEQEKTFRAEQKKMTELSNKVASEQKAKQAQSAKERASYYQQLTVSLTQTLCLYGNGLKALPKNEHVSVILKSAGDKSASGYRDSIMVFNQQDIADCSKDKISAESLLTKGQVYQF